MTGDAAERKARKEVRQAQADYERDVEDARDTRRARFEKAQKDGLSLRAIAEEVGLHWTRVGEILKGK